MSTVTILPWLLAAIGGAVALPVTAVFAWSAWLRCARALRRWRRVPVVLITHIERTPT